MKKMFLFLVLLFICFSVSAYEYSEWSEEYPKDVESDLIESEERYIWYKEEITDVEYLRKEEFGDKDYDLEDYKITEWSEESIFEPTIYEDRIIRSETKNKYSKVSDVDHISLKDFDGEFYLSEITIFDKELQEYIDFEIEDIYFDTYDASHLNNGIYDDYIKVDANTKISVNLGEKRDISKLDITIYYETIEFAYWRFYYDNGFIRVVERAKNSLDCFNCSLVYNYNEMDTSYYYRDLYRGKFYQYTDKLYKTYRFETIYTDDYYSNMEGYIKDENSHKTFYRYITSDIILYDVYGNIVYDDEYCLKNICLAKIIEKEEPKKEEEIENPKTLDDIGESVIICFISFMVIVIVLCFFKKNVINCHTKNKSSFVAFHTK